MDETEKKIRAAIGASQKKKEALRDGVLTAALHPVTKKSNSVLGAVGSVIGVILLIGVAVIVPNLLRMNKKPSVANTGGTTDEVSLPSEETEADPLDGKFFMKEFIDSHEDVFSRISSVKIVDNVSDRTVTMKSREDIEALLTALSGLIGDTAGYDLLLTADPSESNAYRKWENNFYSDYRVSLYYDENGSEEIIPLRFIGGITDKYGLPFGIVGILNPPENAPYRIYGVSVLQSIETARYLDTQIVRSLYPESVSLASLTSDVAGITLIGLHNGLRVQLEEREDFLPLLAAISSVDGTDPFSFAYEYSPYSSFLYRILLRKQNGTTVSLYIDEGVFSVGEKENGAFPPSYRFSGDICDTLYDLCNRLLVRADADFVLRGQNQLLFTNIDPDAAIRKIRITDRNTGKKKEISDTADLSMFFGDLNNMVCPYDIAPASAYDSYVTHYSFEIFINDSADPVSFDFIEGLSTRASLCRHNFAITDTADGSVSFFYMAEDLSYSLAMQTLDTFISGEIYEKTVSVADHLSGLSSLEITNAGGKKVTITENDSGILPAFVSALSDMKGDRPFSSRGYCGCSYSIVATRNDGGKVHLGLLALSSDGWNGYVIFWEKLEDGTYPPVYTIVGECYRNIHAMCDLLFESEDTVPDEPQTLPETISPETETTSPETTGHDTISSETDTGIFADSGIYTDTDPVP